MKGFYQRQELVQMLWLAQGQVVGNLFAGLQSKLCLLLFEELQPEMNRKGRSVEVI